MAKKARFVIRPVPTRTVTETLYKRVKNEHGDGSTLLAETVTRVVKNSFFVQFPAGHSLWFETEAAMNAAGIREDRAEDADDDDDIDISHLIDGKRATGMEQLINDSLGG